jgi:hypothetical protein
MTNAKHEPARKPRPKASPTQVHDYELAGGMEGGMPAGGAGGPGQAELEKTAKDRVEVEKR